MAVGHCRRSRSGRRLLRAAIVVVTLSGQGWAAAPCSLVCQEEIADHTGAGDIATTVHAAGEAVVDSADAPTLFQRIRDETDAARQRYDYPYKVAAYGERVSGLSAAAVSIKSPVAGLSLTALSLALGGVKESVAKVQAEMADRVLAAGLREMEAGDSALASAVSSDPHQAVSRLFADRDFQELFRRTKAGQGLDASALAEVANAKADFLNTRLGLLANAEALDADQVHALDAGLEKAVGDIDHLQAMSQQLGEELRTERVQTHDALEELGQASARDAERVDALVKLEFDHLSPSDKLAVVDSPAFSSVQLSLEQRQSLESAAFVERAGKFVEQADQAAGDVGTIAHALHIEGADNATKNAHVLTGAIINGLKIYSGEPMTMLSGAAGFASMLGGSQDDSSAGFAQISQQIARFQQQMTLFHKEEMEAIHDLHKDMDSGFSNVIRLENRSYRQLNYISIGMRQILDQEIQFCPAAMERWVKSRRDTFDETVEAYSQNGFGNLRNCTKGIEMRLNDFQLQALFLASDITPAHRAGTGRRRGAKGSFDDWNQLVYQPTYHFALARLQRDIPDASGCELEKALFVALAGNGDQFDSISGEWAAALRTCKAGQAIDIADFDDDGEATVDAKGGPDVDFDEVLSQPRETEAIAHYALPAAEVTGLFEFVDSMDSGRARMMRLAEIERGVGVEKWQRAVHDLKLIDFLVSVGIAQTNLVAGDVLFPDLKADLESGWSNSAESAGRIGKAAWSRCDAQGSPAADYYNALCILAHNPTLRFNFIRYLVRSSLNSNPGNVRYNYRGGYVYYRPYVIVHAFADPQTWSSRIAPCPDQSAARWCLAVPVGNVGCDDDTLKPEWCSSSVATAQPPPVCSTLRCWLVPLPDWTLIAGADLAYGHPGRTALEAARAEIRERLSQYQLGTQLNGPMRDLLSAAIKATYAQAALPSCLSMMQAGDRDHPPLSRCITQARMRP